MSWISTTDDGNWYIGPPRLPNRLAEWLFPPKMMQPESRVLLLGTASIFSRWLNWLGIPCIGIRNVTPESLSQIDDQSFDVALASNIPGYLGNLADIPAYLSTAALISKVRPGGRLILLARSEPTGIGYATGHLRSCYARHMGAFSGRCEVKMFGDPWTNWKTWNWVIGLQPRSGYLATVFETPHQPLSPEEWIDQACRASAKDALPCCLWSRHPGRSSAQETTFPFVSKALTGSADSQLGYPSDTPFQRMKAS